jgi:glycerol-3-phosphate dehydrogenase (NAD(P)+)
VTGARSAVAVLGAGSWGTALAAHLGRQGRGVRLWGRDPVLMKEIDQTRESARYLPGISLPPEVRATSEGVDALSGAAIVIVAVPSQFLEAVVRGLKETVPPGAVLVSATKGLDPVQGRRLSQLLSDLFPRHPIAALSGPSFAREVAMGQPTALVIATPDHERARQLQQCLSGPRFRLYTNRDLIGVEIAGALKNVVAIATGLADGLGLGENARAALITRGLAEIARLGVALGARPPTFVGLAGVGDLVLTCTGSLSRNRALGREIARGRALEAVEQDTRMIAEGVRTVSSAIALARRTGVAMPICEQVGAVLFNSKPVRDALQSLLARDPRPEEDEPRER